MVSLAPRGSAVQFDVIDAILRGFFMAGRSLFVALIAAPLTLLPTGAFAQDVPGIEICTVEKTMERRTSCLQSNVDFLQKSMTKLTGDYQQRLDAANRQIETLKAAAASLQKTVNDLQATQKQIADDLKKKADAPPAKDAASAKDAK
jgi:TolA-binding protein